MFPDDDDDQVYRQLAHFWLPEARVEDLKALVPLREWEAAGVLSVTPGNVCDYVQVREFLGAWMERFDVREIYFDPREAEETTQLLAEDHALERIAVTQSGQSLHDAVTEYERLILKHTMRHNGNPILTWQAGHVAIDDRKYKIPMKQRKGDYRTIDGIVAAIMSLKGAMIHESSPYDERGVLAL